LAQYVVVPRNVVVPIPQGWKATEAAAGPLVYLTAHQALTMWGSLAGDNVLVTGTSGGVGLATVHLARARGLRVIGLTRHKAKSRRLKQQGCDAVVEAGSDLKAAIRKIAGKGVHLIVDNVAGPLLNQLFDILADGGRISVVGMLAGPVPSFNTAKLIFRRIRMGGVLVSGYSPVEAQNAWRLIIKQLKKTGRKPVVDSVFPFDELHAAFDRLAGGPFGKVVVRIPG
jgi:NADPH2:quinone reductase